MTPTIFVLLLAMSWLSIKHFLGDFVLQTPWQLNNKHRYGHLGGIVHVLLHVGLTLPVFWLLPTSVMIAGLLLFAEALVHYHLDWAKNNLIIAKSWTPADHGFWVAFGFDQLVHILSYIAGVWILVSV